MAKPIRKAISTKTRFEVFKRDCFVCQYCGGHPPEVQLHVDHIIPVADGGPNSMDNFVTSCDRCNLGKGARSLGAIPDSLSVRAAETVEREAQIKGYAKVMAAHRQRVEDDCWEVADIWTSSHGKDSIRKDYFQSIRNFVEKLGVHECIRAMEITTARRLNQDKSFRYFCGICWNLIRENSPNA